MFMLQLPSVPVTHPNLDPALDLDDGDPDECTWIRANGRQCAARTRHTLADGTHMCRAHAAKLRSAPIIQEVSA